MKNVLHTPKVYMLAGLLAIAVTAIAWQTKTKKQPHDTTTGAAANADTTKPRKHAVNEDDDFGLKGLDNINVNLGNINLDGLDTTIEKSVRLALSSIDFNQIGKITNDALKNIDWNEINLTVNKAMREANEQIKNIDWNEIKLNVNKAMNEANEQVKNIDWDKINADINEATSKLNSKEFKNQFNNENIEQIVNNALEKAHESIGEAKATVKLWKDFVSELDKDGLIDKKKGYKLEWNEDGELYINDKKQTKEVADKYRKYYKEGGYTISNNGEEAEQL